MQGLCQSIVGTMSVGETRILTTTILTNQLTWKTIKRKSGGWNDKTKAHSQKEKNTFLRQLNAIANEQEDDCFSRFTHDSNDETPRIVSRASHYSNTNSEQRKERPNNIRLVETPSEKYDNNNRNQQNNSSDTASKSQYINNHSRTSSSSSTRSWK